MTRLITIVRSAPFAAAMIALLVTPAGAQTPTKTPVKSGAYKAPRTVDGQPDLQGIWASATITALERPAELANIEVFTPQEAADYERKIHERNNFDNRNVDRNTDVSRAYNDAWWDRGTKVIKTRRTSLLVDPTDGKLPPLTAAAQARLAARAEALKVKCLSGSCSFEFNGPVRAADWTEDRSPAERCIVWPTSGPPMMPTAYNNNYQIVQTAGYVAIVVEMIHDVRLIPIDATPHLPSKVRPWLGDSRGHWEGDTLVVETTNFNGRVNYRNTSANMRVVERFTRTDAETLTYRFTVEDPETYTRPWTVEIPMYRSSEPLFEYACHEGNYGMTGLLAGAREVEKKAGENKK